MKVNKNNGMLWVLILLILYSSPSFAGSISGTVNDLQNEFNTVVSNWIAPLKEMAKWLLLSLAVISYTWAASMMLLRGADIQEFFAEFVRMVVFTGFFYWLIQDASTLAGAIVNGWIWIGTQAGGSVSSPNVGGIIERGFILGSAIYESSEGIAASIVAGILSVVVMMIYAFIAAKALFVMLEMYVVTSAGIILLGFGGNDWTADYAKRYITYTMATGVKLFVLYLIVATGDNFLSGLTSSVSYDSIPDMLAVVGIVLLILVLIWQIPDTVQAMLSGASIGSAGSTAAGAAKAAGSAVAGAAGGAAVGAAGGLMALKEAAAMASTQPGSSSGFQYKAMNTMNNLANAAGAVVGNRIMGDYNASSGSFGGSMAQQMRQQSLGGNGLYGGGKSDNSHIGGSTGNASKGCESGGSIGKAGAAAAAEASAASYPSPAVDLTKGS